MRSFLFFLILFSSNVFSQNIKKNIYGFATSNTFTYCNVLDTNFLNKVVDLSPKILRFPGGALGNFYHYNSQGYGFDFDEIDKYHGGKFPKRSRGLERSRIKNNHNYDYIEDFIELAKRTKSKAVLVANIFSRNNDILLMIDKLIKSNIEVVGVELGSELSNLSYFKNGYTINDYINNAKYYAKKIKRDYPNIKIGVVAAPLGKKRGHRHNIWNKKLNNESFYDAIIIHSYAKVIKGNDLDGQMTSEITESSNIESQFNLYKDRLVDFLFSSYPDEVQKYVKLFNRPIWITEWNLQMSKTTANTFFQSLFVVNYLLEIFCNPDLNFIELCTYHNLGGRDFSGSIFRNDNDLIVQATYDFFILVEKVFELNVVNIKREKKKNTYIYSCYNKKRKLVSSYEINWDLSYFKYSIYKDEILKDTLIFDYDLYNKANSKGKFN